MLFSNINGSKPKTVVIVVRTMGLNLANAVSSKASIKFCLFLIRKLKEEPDHAVLRIVREVKDGEW